MQAFGRFLLGTVGAFAFGMAAAVLIGLYKGTLSQLTPEVVYIFMGLAALTSLAIYMNATAKSPWHTYVGNGMASHSVLSVFLICFGYSFKLPWMDLAQALTWAVAFAITGAAAGYGYLCVAGRVPAQTEATATPPAVSLEKKE